MAYRSELWEKFSIVAKKLFYNPWIEPKSQKFADYSSWQYSTGEHSSSKKAIVGFVELFVHTDSDRFISVGHLVVRDFSGWVPGWNLTYKCNIVQISGNGFLLPNRVHLSQIDAGHRSHFC